MVGLRGGVAGAVQATTTLARLGSSLTSGGLANPVVASLELAGSLALSLAGLFAPLLAGVAVVIALPIVGIVGWRSVRRRGAVGAV